jgi:hypothetical protein
MPTQKPRSTRREKVRDAAGLLGIAAITAGTGLKFGLPFALIVGGVFVVALVIYDAWAAD